MTQVSRYPVSPRVYERIFEIFFQSSTKIRKKEEAEQFFNDFFTPTEKIMLAKRLSIAVLLAKKYDYNSIRKILRVSPPTIAGVSKLMQFSKGYQLLVGKILKEEAIKNILLDLVEGVAIIGSQGGKGSNIWWEVRKTVKEKKRAKRF